MILSLFGSKINGLTKEKFPPAAAGSTAENDSKTPFSSKLNLKTFPR